MRHPRPPYVQAAARFLPSLLLGGCLALPVPPDLASLQLSKVNSPRVTLWNTWFEKRSGQPFLCGHAFRRHPAADEDTTGTHLRLTLYDRQGRSLQVLPAELVPRQIPRGARRAGYSSFAVPLNELPAAAARIEVQAYDDPDPTLPKATR
jgi:hypothetical protein